MTDSTRGVRFRRGSRRPGWALLSALLVLAIVASSALVFTDRVELLKLAVILALWAAVVAAFVSFIYRRQSDVEGAKARDLKLVYDLQLDREISARREYELSVESQLRRELTSEMRAQANDEVAGLRAELAALRASLQILFDTDLQDRPALETDRASVRAFRDWPGEGTGRVISSRIDAAANAFDNPNTEEHPIIDVPVEPVSMPEQDLSGFGGAHRMSSDVEQPRHGWPDARSPQAAPAAQPAPAPEPVPTPEPVAQPVFAPPPAPIPEPIPEPVAETKIQFPWLPAEPAASAASAEPAESPSEAVASEWRLPPLDDFRSIAHPPVEAAEPSFGTGAPLSSFDYDPRPFGTPEPAMVTTPSSEPPRGRHSTGEPLAGEPEKRGRHYSETNDPGRPTPPPTLAAAAPPTPPLAPIPPAAAEPPSARHRGGDDSQESEEASGQHTGGQPLSELLSRLQAGASAGGRRRRRDE